MTNEEIKKQITEICKVGQGEKCCKYLVAGAAGIECAKISDFKNVIDKNWLENEHIAQGDNCEGKDFSK
jgi:hypothetical protein